MTTPEELEQLFFTHFPDKFWLRAIRATFAAHTSAAEECARQFDKPEATNVLPFYRRGKLEGHLRDVAGLFPEMTATTAKSSSWHRVELRSGPALLTASAVPTPGAMVEPADYRESFARDSQLSIFGEAPRSPDAVLYALMLHSRFHPDAPGDQAYARLPGSLYVAFPAPNLQYYVHSVDIFGRYPDEVAKHLPSEWTSTARLRYFHRARKAETA